MNRDSRGLLWHSALPAAQLADRMAKHLRAHINDESVDPTRPAASRVIVRGDRDALVLYVMGDAAMLVPYALVGRVSSGPESGSALRFERERLWRRSRSRFVDLTVGGVMICSVLISGVQSGLASALIALGGLVLVGAVMFAVVFAATHTTRARAEQQAARLEAMIAKTLETGVLRTHLSRVS